MNSHLEEQLCIQPKGFYYKCFLVLHLEKNGVYTSVEDKMSDMHHFGFY